MLSDIIHIHFQSFDARKYIPDFKQCFAFQAVWALSHELGENHVASIIKGSFKFDQLLFNNPIRAVHREFPFFAQRLKI